jgi:hypothetical protein
MLPRMKCRPNAAHRGELTAPRVPPGALFCAHSSSLLRVGGPHRQERPGWHLDPTDRTILTGHQVTPPARLCTAHLGDENTQAGHVQCATNFVDCPYANF